jgi:hypothetical protein
MNRPKSLLQSLAGLEVMACLFIAAIFVSIVLVGRLSRGAAEAPSETNTFPPMCSDAPIAERIDALMQAIPLPQVGYDQPPIISLPESQGYHFISGSAELSEEFRTKLGSGVTERLIEIATHYGLDVIEVVGHTDEVPVSSATSNLDAHLLPFLRGEGSVQQLAFADNAGLGISRAAAVVKELAQNPLLGRFTIIPLSAGQTVLSNGILSTGATNRGGEEDRRRIEIRLRRSATVDAGRPGGEVVALNRGGTAPVNVAAR